MLDHRLILPTAEPSYITDIFFPPWKFPAKKRDQGTATFVYERCGYAFVEHLVPSTLVEVAYFARAFPGLTCRAGLLMRFAAG